MAGKYDRKDHFYRKAKEEGRRSRAFFKLRDLDNKYHLFRSGSKVLDLGAWPGGWLEYVSQRVGGRGLAVGIDLVEIEPLGKPQVKTVTGDVRDDESIEQLKELSGGQYDVIISDMSPKLTGIKSVDRVAAVGLAELAFWVCEQMLRPGGHFTAKVFKGNETEEFVKMIRPRFNKVLRSEVSSTRKTSSEFYLVGISYKGTE